MKTVASSKLRGAEPKAAPRRPSKLLQLTRDAAVVGVLVLADALACVGAVALGALEHAWVHETFDWWPLDTLSAVLVGAFLMTAATLSFLFRGAYLKRDPFWERVRYTTKALVLGIFLAVWLISVFPQRDWMRRSLLLLAGVNLVMILPALRAVAIWGLARIGLWRLPVLVLGKSGRIDGFRESLERDSGLGYRVVEAIDVDQERWVERVPAGFGEVFICAGGLTPHELAAVVTEVQPRVPKVTVAPDLAGIPFVRGQTRFLFEDRQILLTTRNLLKDPVNLLAKRLFDILVCLLLLPLALPAMAAIAVAIRIDSVGSPVFVQSRVGRRGRRFRMFKFRTMRHDAEVRLGRVLEDPDRRAEWDRFQKLRNDPRVTRVGRWLRTTSLDEVPQLLNVLTGSMSLVGPRPLPDYHYDLVPEPFRSDYLDVRPGMTGLWQVSGRSDADADQMAEYNSWYVRNWSLWLDLTVLLRTIPVTLLRRGAV